MLRLASVFLLISDGWNQWIQQPRLTLPRSWTRLLKRGSPPLRVMPDPHKDIGLNILSQFHYGPEIQIATFETLADALQSLTER